MDNFNNQPVAPTPFSTPPVTSAPLPPKPGRTPVMPGGHKPGMITTVLLIFLGMGVLIFGGLAIFFYSQAQTAINTLETQKAAAVAQAKSEQKKADDEANTRANESPFRSYVAPTEYGSFEIKFPKNWSGYVDQQKSGTQISLTANPDFIRRTNGTDELSALRVQLIERTTDQFMNSYSSLVKRGTLKQADVVVSGQKGFDLTGGFQDKRTTRMVVIPVRDKVLVFTNENSRYASEFNEILAQSHIIP